MSEITDIVVPILRTMQADIGLLKEAVRRIDARLVTLDSYMGGFYSSLRNHRDEIDEHRGRIEALEERGATNGPPAS